MHIDFHKRNPGLDIARCIAILLVMFSHTLWISNNYPALVKYAMQLTGTIGVEIFFAISGFLIGRMVLRMVNVESFSFSDIKSFWVRRWFRTLPNYYFVLLINLAVWLYAYGEMPEKLYLYFFFLNNFFSTSPDFFRISWSLAVEQFCYVLGPLMLFAMVRLSPKSNRNILYLLMSFSMITVFLIVRMVFDSTHIENSMFDWNEKLRKVSIYRLDAIYYGFVLYYLYSKKIFTEAFGLWMFRSGIAALLFLHIFIFATPLTIEKFQMFYNVFYLSLNSVAICATIPYLADKKISPSPIIRAVTWISVLSYSIYLLHYTVILHFMKTVWPSDNLSGFSLYGYTFTYYLIVLATSYLTFRFFEKPMTDLREQHS